MNPTSIIVCVYAVLVIVGGVIGFVKAGSRPSLIAGILGGLALLTAGYGISRPGNVWGLPLALVLTTMLLVFFTVRYLRGAPRAFMPGGLMAILSLLALAGVLAASHGI